MTDKEQIIIDGVDVSRCVFYQIEANKLHPKAQYCGSMRNIFCEDEPNCYFKQLARKTQECEELKDARFNLNCEIYSLNRYRKALEEIEKVINNILNSCLGRNTVSCRPAHNVCGDLINILDIINKAKGADNHG